MGQRFMRKVRVLNYMSKYLASCRPNLGTITYRREVVARELYVHIAFARCQNALPKVKVQIKD